MQTIKILNAAGEVVASSPFRSNAKRISMRAAAEQRQIQSMHCPGAVFAVLERENGSVTKFKFDAAGYPQFLWGVK